DWGEVVRAGTVILTQKAKDISVAIWLCMGLYQTQGYKGLSVGLEICYNIIDKFWEVLYPPLKRIRGRAAPIIWLAVRLNPLVTEKAPTDSDAEAVVSCAITLEKFVELLDEKFGDNSPTRSEAPNILDLRKTIQSYAIKFKEEEKPAQAEVTEKSSEQQTTTPTTTTAPSPTTAQPIEFTSVDNAYQWIMRAANFLRENKPDNPIPYKLSRVIKWYPIAKLPPATDGKTQLPGILPQLVQAFQNLLNGNEWDTLLRQSEANFPNAPLWFDLQRFIDRAMMELGPSYEFARQVVREEVANIVRRLPGILDLQFKNGIPFADGQTKMWIEAEVLPSIATVGSEQKETKSSDETTSKKDGIAEIVAEARRIVAGGKLEDALSLLNGHLANASLRREQFLWRLNLAKLCLDAGNARLALPQLESLDEEVRKFSLEQWEPELAVEVLKSLLQCRKKLMADIKQPSPELMSIISELYSRLCRLDVVSALNLDSA
ncbi:MAG: type VI secretion system protein TssA, partial [Candidatus Poribacteria bacterium]